MQEPSRDEGLSLFPEAAERYSPTPFAVWQSAAAQIPPEDERGPEWRAFRPLPVRELNIAYQLAASDWERASGAREAYLQRRFWQQERARAKVDQILDGEKAALVAVLQDLGCQLQHGKLVAIGDHFERGKPPKRVIVPSWCFEWDYWRGRYGEIVRFGGIKDGYQISKLRVYLREDAARIFPQLFPETAGELGKPDMMCEAPAYGAGDGLRATELVAEIPAAPDRPKDTMALRGRAADWLARFVADKKHKTRDLTIAQMRAEHYGLGARGAKKVFVEYSKAHPEAELSKAGRPKSNRNTK